MRNNVCCSSISIFFEENNQLDANNDNVIESCIYCDKKDHGKVNCWAKKADKSDENDQDLIPGL